MIYRRTKITMKRKILFTLVILSFILFFHSTNDALAFGGSGNNVCNDTFFEPVSRIDGKRVDPIYVINDPATGQRLEIYPVVEFNECSTRQYYLERGNENTYKDRMAYYKRIGRPYMFYNEYGNSTHGIFGSYVPYVTGVATGYNLEALPGFTQEMYKRDPSLIYRNFFRSGTDGTGTAFTWGGNIAHNIKNTAMIPNSGSRNGNQTGTNKIPAHFKIQYAPKYSRDGRSVATFDGLVGRGAEFRLLGYTNIGTDAFNPYFYDDIFSNSMLGGYPRDKDARTRMKTIYDGNQRVKRQLFKFYMLNNPYTSQNYKSVNVWHKGHSRSLDWLVRNIGEDETVRNYHTAFLPMGHPGLTLGSWFTDSHNGQYHSPLVTAGLPKPNLRVENMTLKRGNSVISEYQKSSQVIIPPNISKGREFFDLRPAGTVRVGEDYSLTVTVKDVTVDPKRAGINRKETPILDIYFVCDKHANEMIPHFDKTDPRLIHRRVEGKFLNSKTMEFNMDINLPETVDPNSRLRIVAVVPQEYSLTGDNAIFEDDYAHLPLEVQKNNLIMQQVEILDRNNRVVNQIVGGQEYRVRYTFKYEGANVNDVPITVRNINVRNSKNGSLIYLNNETLTANRSLRNGQSYQFTTRFFRVDSNAQELYAEGRVSSDDKWNSVKTDDRGEVEIAFIPDLSISIDKVSPDVINKNFSSSENRNIQISYSVDLIGAPETIMSTNVRFRVINTATNTVLANQLVTIPIKGGRNTFTQNFNIHLRSVGTAGLRDTIRIEAEVNPDRNQPTREQRWDNNKSVTAMNLYHARLNNDICSSTIPVRTRNTWRQTYDITMYRGRLENFERDICTGWSLVDGYWMCTSTRKDIYQACVYSSITQRRESRNIEETYEIQRVLFTTREGTFDLLRQRGRIKAGYGFELDIILSYNTNSVSQHASVQWFGSTCNHDLASPPPIPLQPHEIPENIYLIMPDGQILSNSGRGGTNAILQTVSRVGPWTNRTYRIQIVSGNTFDRRVTNKLYINDKTRNGVYNMTICTDPFYGQQLPPFGVSALNKRNMYDKRTLTFEVVGGHTEDIKLQIIR